MLPEDVDLPVALGADTADPDANLIGITLVVRLGTTSRRGTILGVEVNRKVAEDAEGQRLEQR